MPQQNNTLTEQEKSDGWVLLFDGESTDQWRGFQKSEFPGGWQVVDGTIHRADKAGDIITKEQFDNFELLIDWKVEGPGNSGIMYRVTEDEDEPWKTGPEYQILNNEVHRDG
ncbi:MAG: 3-keto-disaccharide hydrolase, partial [Planctomycetota bacterium]